MSAPAFPPEHAARFKGLGRPLAEFRARAAHFVGLVFLTALSVLGGVALLGVGAVGFVATLSGRPAGFGIDHTVYGVLGAVALFALVGVGVRRMRQTSGLRVFVCERGVARVQGEEAELMYWREVTAVRRSSFTSTERGGGMNAAVRVTLEADEDDWLEFDESLGGLKEFREMAEKHTLPYLLPPVRDAFDAGEEVFFGPLGLSRKGLRHQRQFLRWEDYAGGEVKRGEVIVRGKGRWLAFCKVRASRVANTHVLLALAEHAVGRRG